MARALVDIARERMMCVRTGLIGGTDRYNGAVTGTSRRPCAHRRPTRATRYSIRKINQPDLSAHGARHAECEFKISDQMTLAQLTSKLSKLFLFQVPVS